MVEDMAVLHELPGEDLVASAELKAPPAGIKIVSRQTGSSSSELPLTSRIE